MDGGTERLALAQLIRWLKQVAGVPRMPGRFAWATVDVDRSIRDLGLEDDPPWVAVDEPLLGATGRRITFGTSSCVVLEPPTEPRVGWLERPDTPTEMFVVRLEH